MRYIGSKAASLPTIVRVVGRAGLKTGSLCDPFAGTCTVARHFKALGWRVVTGDVLSQSHTLQTAYLAINHPPLFRKLTARLSLNCGVDGEPHERVVKYLDRLPGDSGFVTETYSLAGKVRRKFFTVQNARRIDHVRETIRRWAGDSLISGQEASYLLACLLEAVDRVANTAGTYYAYLKEFYRKAVQPLRLLPLRVVDNGLDNRVYLIDAAALLARTRADVVYLDPPYNQRDYGAYYHLPETLVRWDRPEVTGKSGMRGPAPESPFYHRATAGDGVRELIHNADCSLLVVHYATDGLVPHHTILRLLKTRGSTHWMSWQVRGYSSAKGGQDTKPVSHRLYWCVPNAATVVRVDVNV